jgi:hypothetical protein
MANLYDVSDVHDDAFNLAYMMDKILEKVVAVFTSYNVPLPDRQYWTMGTPIVDCEQVVISFIQMYLGPPGDQASTPQRCNVPRTAVVSVQIARAIPTVGQNGRPPSAEKINEGSRIAAVDAYVLMESMQVFDVWNNDDGGYGLGVIATVDGPSAEGGFQTISMQLTLAIP